MSIDRLNKAASAAGFAMATPEEALDPGFEVAAGPNGSESRALVLATPLTEAKPKSDLLATVATWLKGYVPGFGGRLPA